MDETLKFIRSFNNKQVYLLSVPSFGSIPSDLGPLGPHFGLLLALDARGIPDAELSHLAHRAIKQGAVCVCAWGPDCQRVELLFDYGCVDLRPEESVESVILTTSHDGESLKEVVEFFLETVEPASDHKFDTRGWLVAAVGSDAWAREIEDLILSTPSLDDFA